MHIYATACRVPPPPECVSWQHVVRLFMLEYDSAQLCSLHNNKYRVRLIVLNHLNTFFPAGTMGNSDAAALGAELLNFIPWGLHVGFLNQSSISV